MSLRDATSTVKCRAFHLTLSGVAKNWYRRLPPRNIRSWSEFKKMFLKRFAMIEEGEAPI